MKKMIWIVFTVTLLPLMAYQDQEETEEERLIRERMERNLRQARVLLQDKKYEEALKKFEALSEEHPTNIEIQLEMMNTYGTLRKPDQLKSFAAKKISKDVSVPNMLLSANEKIWDRDFEGAEKKLAEVLEIDEESYMAHYLFGYIYWGMKNRDEAIESFKKTVELKEDFAEPYYFLGDLYLFKRDKEMVRKYWSKYLDLVPQEGTRFKFVKQTLQKLGGS